MNVTHVHVDRREEWNGLAAQAPYLSIMQSWEWGEFKEKFGWKVFRVAAERDGRIVAGAQVLVRTLVKGMAGVAYVPRGPAGDWLDEDTASSLFSELHRVARLHRAVFLKVEPPLLQSPPVETTLQRQNFRVSPYHNQARASLVIDLSQGLDEILARMHHKTRYNIRYAEKNGVVVREGSREDLAPFYRLMKSTARRGGFTARSRDYYEHQWNTLAPLGRIRLLVASYRGEPLAVNMSALFGRHAAYLHGASSQEHKNLMPNHLLMWEAVRWAGSRDCTTYDLWGIPDEVGQAVHEGDGPPKQDRTGGLWGAYRFKRGFGGNVVLYMRAHDYVYAPLFYGFIANRLVNSAAMDRIASWLDNRAPSGGT